MEWEDGLALTAQIGALIYVIRGGAVRISSIFETLDSRCDKRGDNARGGKAIRVVA